MRGAVGMATDVARWAWAAPAPNDVVTRDWGLRACGVLDNLSSTAASGSSVRHGEARFGQGDVGAHFSAHASGAIGRT